jgi:hypothetical protein
MRFLTHPCAFRSTKAADAKEEQVSDDFQQMRSSFSALFRAKDTRQLVDPLLASSGVSLYSVDRAHKVTATTNDLVAVQDDMQTWASWPFVGPLLDDTGGTVQHNCAKTHDGVPRVTRVVPRKSRYGHPYEWVILTLRMG